MKAHICIGLDIQINYNVSTSYSFIHMNYRFPSREWMQFTYIPSILTLKKTKSKLLNIVHRKKLFGLLYLYHLFRRWMLHLLDCCCKEKCLFRSQEIHGVQSTCVIVQKNTEMIHSFTSFKVFILKSPFSHAQVWLKDEPRHTVCYSDCFIFRETMF